MLTSTVSRCLEVTSGYVETSVSGLAVMMSNRRNLINYCNKTFNSINRGCAYREK